MIYLTILASITIIGLIVALGAALGVAQRAAALHAEERRDWTTERLMLVNRVIAKHVGEVAHLDKTAGPTTPSREHVQQPIAAGL